MLDLPRHSFAMLLALLLLTGCASEHIANPSFPLTRDQARHELDDMSRQPVPPARPLLVLGGWFDPGIAARRVKRRLARATGNRKIITAAFFFDGTFENCRKHAVDAVEKAYPSSDPAWTTEVDVIAISMGGLVARYAAAGPDPGTTPAPGTAPGTAPGPGPGQGTPPGKRLRIARLFTISTPHRGAAMARLPTFDPLVRDMRAGSDFLRCLDRCLDHPEYPIFTYGRLGDRVVGCPNTALPKGGVWWVDTPFPSLAHIKAYKDPRILADIARRLRGEKPYATDPPAPVPPEASKPAERPNVPLTLNPQQPRKV